LGEKRSRGPPKEHIVFEWLKKKRGVGGAPLAGQDVRGRNCGSSARKQYGRWSGMDRGLGAQGLIKKSSIKGGTIGGGKGPTKMQKKGARRNWGIAKDRETWGGGTRVSI